MFPEEYVSLYEGYPLTINSLPALYVWLFRTHVRATFPVGFKFSMRKFEGGPKFAMPPWAELKTEK